MSDNQSAKDRDPSVEGHLISASSFNEMVFSPKQEDLMLEVKDEKLDQSIGLQQEALEGCIINRKSARCLSKNQNLMLGIYFALFAAITWSRFYQY